MNAFLIHGKWITDKNDIRDMYMWANRFKDLGKPSVSPCFDHEFYDRVPTRVRNIFASCQNELPGTLNEPLQYQEVFNVSSKLVRCLWCMVFLLRAYSLWRSHFIGATSLFISGIFQ